MKIADDIATIKSDIQAIKSLFLSIPNWIPLSDTVAQSFGYASSDGLRGWCKKNLHPEYFKKFGRTYHIHKSVLNQISKS